MLGYHPFSAELCGGTSLVLMPWFQLQDLRGDVLPTGYHYV